LKSLNSHVFSSRFSNYLSFKSLWLAKSFFWTLVSLSTVSSLRSFLLKYSSSLFNLLKTPFLNSLSLLLNDVNKFVKSSLKIITSSFKDETLFDSLNYLLSYSNFFYRLTTSRLSSSYFPFASRSFSFSPSISIPLFVIN